MRQFTPEDTARMRHEMATQFAPATEIPIVARNRWRSFTDEEVAELLCAARNTDESIDYQLASCLLVELAGETVRRTKGAEQ